MVRAAEPRELRSARAASAARSAPGASSCPRCAARLLYDGEKLSCLMCGYEHATPASHVHSASDLLDALPPLREHLIGHADALGPHPEPGSRASEELRTASETEAAALQFGRLYAYQCLVSSGQALIALARGLEPPTPEYGTWSIAKTILDSSSFACWLLDPDLGRRERARRALAVQLADLDAQVAFLAAQLAERPEDADRELLAETAERRDALRSNTAVLGALPSVPAAADRAQQLGAAFEHLMCSTVLEGRPWALLRTAAIQGGDYSTDRVRSILTTQVQLSASWYARAVWAYVSWMSREALPELQASLEFAFDSVALPDDPETRFWRYPRATSRGRVRATAPAPARGHR